VLQCVVVCCSVLQCVDGDMLRVTLDDSHVVVDALCCSVLQCVTVCCSVFCSVLQCDAVRCSALHSDALQVTLEDSHGVPL